MDIQNITVVVNPAAANGGGHAAWQALSAQFSQLFDTAGCKLQVIETVSRQHTLELGASLDCQLILAVSGDGTLHDLAQGLMARPAAQRPALSALPIGSGNDYARALGIPAQPQAALAALRAGQLRWVDISRVTVDQPGTPEQPGQQQLSYCLNTLSFGIDAAIASQTEQLRKRTGGRGFGLYSSAAVRTILTQLKAHHISITAQDASLLSCGKRGARPQSAPDSPDTQMILDDHFLICAIQNGPTYGGGFLVAPAASIQDGLLNICLATRAAVPRALYYMTRLAAGRHEQLPIITTLTARQLDIVLDAPVPIQSDGETLQATRLSIQLLPAALQVLTPCS